MAKIYATNNGVEDRDSVNILNIPKAKISKLHKSVIIV